jgi:hypothetical protein
MRFAIPPSARLVPDDSLVRAPFILNDAYLWRHDAAAGLAGPVVMFGTVQGGTDAYGPGTHDGIRDGAGNGARGRIMRGYVSLADWMAAGNRDPRDLNN